MSQRRGLNDAFEKAAKAAEKRLERAVKAQEKRLESVAKKLSGELTNALQSAVKAAIRDVESIAKQTGLTKEEARELRQGLETVDGLIAGAKRGASALAVLGPQGATVGGLVGGLAGGLVGFSLEDIRQQVQRVRDAADAARAELERALAGFDRDLERLRSLRARTGRLG